MLLLVWLPTDILATCGNSGLGRQGRPRWNPKLGVSAVETGDADTPSDLLVETWLGKGGSWVGEEASLVLLKVQMEVPGLGEK